MIKRVLYGIALYLIAMVLTYSLSCLFDPLEKEGPPPSTHGEGDIIHPRLTVIQEHSENDEAEKQIEAADSSESVASPFTFQVNILPEEKPLLSGVYVFHFTEPSDIAGKIFFELEKRKKYSICLCRRRFCRLHK